jgi:hypothetical protein
MANDNVADISISATTYCYDTPSQTADSIADDEEYGIDYDSVIEIPVWKRMVFKFGKPRKVVFYY